MNDILEKCSGKIYPKTIANFIYWEPEKGRGKCTTRAGKPARICELDGNIYFQLVELNAPLEPLEIVQGDGTRTPITRDMIADFPVCYDTNTRTRTTKFILPSVFLAMILFRKIKDVDFTWKVIDECFQEVYISDDIARANHPGEFQD